MVYAYKYVLEEKLPLILFGNKMPERQLAYVFASRYSDKPGYLSIMRELFLE
jgi:hypothetical protein